MHYSREDGGRVEVLSITALPFTYNVTKYYLHQRRLCNIVGKMGDVLRYFQKTALPTFLQFNSCQSSAAVA